MMAQEGKQYPNSWYFFSWVPVCGLRAMKEEGTSVLDIISEVFKYVQLKVFLIYITTFRYILNTCKVKIQFYVF